MEESDFMRISLYILYERLTKWNPVMAQKNGADKKLFLGSQLMKQDTEPLPWHVLLEHADYFNKSCFSNCGIISVGTPDKTVLAENFCICLSENADLYEIYREVQKIFMKFSMWSEELNKAVLVNASLEEICSLSIPVFENPIFIHDTNSEVLVSINEMPGQGQFSWDYDPVTDKHFLPMDIMNDFKISPEYQQTMNTTGSQMFSERQFGYRILYINLWFEESYLGRICVNELGREIVRGDYELLEYLANIVLSALRQGNILLTDISRDLKESLIELLDSNKTNETILSNRLEAFGWHMDDSFFCASIILSERDYSTYAINYTCRRLENMFPHYCIFLYKDRILIVFNLRKSKITSDDFFSKLAIFLREGLFKASVSAIGHDFRQFHYYYIQTTAAFKIGSDKNPMLWLYKFNDYILPYFFEQATSELLPTMLCEPNLLELYQYDKKHQTEYFKTLRVYLENERNIAHTANALYVHRSTLLYRLNKIQSLIKVNLDKPKIRFHLILSYELFDIEG